MIEGSLIPAGAQIVKRVAPYIVAVVLGGAGVSYAVHEHHGAQTLATQNELITAQLAASQSQLDATHSQLDALTTKINTLAANNEARVAPSTANATKPSAARRRASAAQDARFKKLQSQLDAQGKAIDDARNDLTSTRTELSGSIARTHDELVVLEKKGERSYYEFDIQKSKEFKRTGPLGISLRKANEKHQYADLQLMVEDRTLTQKHVNLYQPAMFFQPDSQQPIQIVINSITKDHIHGYVSSPKYRPSELAAVSGADANPAKDSSAQPPSRQKLTLSESDLNQR